MFIDLVKRFDGRMGLPFSLRIFSNLPELTRELNNKDVALVTFTVRHFGWKAAESEARHDLTPKSPMKMCEKEYKSTLGFNILDVIFMYRDKRDEEGIEEFF